MSACKKIYDPVHGFIRFSALEKDLIDSYAFERLHYIHQLGIAYLVYPGASHTRFEHSLGVMEVASQIFDKITEDLSFLKKKEPVSYWRQVIRFAALCHDLGHLPFSHLAEKQLLGSGGHEEWTASLIQSSFLSPIWEQFVKEFPGEAGIEDIIKISLGEKKYKLLKGNQESFTPWEKVMSEVIAGDFFGADRIDYLLRDARCTGVSYGLFDYHQLIEMLQILPSEEEGLTLGIEENGIASCEALLLARHFMHRRVYQYPSVQAYSFHMERFMKKVYAEHAPLDSLEKYLSFSDAEISSLLRKAFLDPSALGHEDALAMFTKEHRFSAIELPPHITKSHIDAWKKNHHILDEEAEAVFFSEKEEGALFSFPVLKGGKILDAALCSDISVPTFSVSWLYVSQNHIHHLPALLEGAL